jgi:hypothetical protein
MYFLLAYKKFDYPISIYTQNPVLVFHVFNFVFLFFLPVEFTIDAVNFYFAREMTRFIGSLQTHQFIPHSTFVEVTFSSTVESAECGLSSVDSLFSCIVQFVILLEFLFEVSVLVY